MTVAKLPWTPWLVGHLSKGRFGIRRIRPDATWEAHLGPDGVETAFADSNAAHQVCADINQADRLDLAVLADWHKETIVPFAVRETLAGKRVVLGAKLNGGAFVVQIDGEETYRGHDHAWALESFYAA